MDLLKIDKLNLRKFFSKNFPSVLLSTNEGQKVAVISLAQTEIA
jgi:hypothetical protein